MHNDAEAAERSVTKYVPIDTEPSIIGIDQTAVYIDEEAVTPTDKVGGLTSVDGVVEDLKVSGDRSDGLVRQIEVPVVAL